MLNSRPLLACSINPGDFDVLTPNDFIIKKFDNFVPGDYLMHVSSFQQVELKLDSDNIHFCMQAWVQIRNVSRKKEVVHLKTIHIFLKNNLK